MATAAHRAKVTGYVDAGVKQGARLIVDGRNHQVAGYEQGFFLGGTLFDSVLFGDHHAYGEDSVRFHTRYKSIMQRWPDSIAKGAEFTMPVAK
ncbi:Malonate-semialdehyde dehydrogenase [Paraburkholderia solisilvae]|uniref:Malonate-semialdehyde dehydrogenase n=1 Tax=Paraburkholderia solisilvae TaxID=624376 RepID=A0A6J5E2V0_9BURK|nr:Malonate-semialdehyde dehydrogenase [Paraburkholderia solisilvae]